MKKLIYILIAIAVVASIAFTLASNKEEMAEKVALAQKTNDRIPVVAATVKEEKIVTNAKATGSFKPYKEITLLSETQGRVTKILKEKGDFVKAGELLVRVDDQLLRSDLKVSQLNYEKAKRDLERFETMVEKEAITQRQLEDTRMNFENAEARLTTLKKQLAYTYIKAPISGTLDEEYIEIGSFLSPGAKLYDIVNTQQLKMVVKISEQDVLKIDVGQEVEITADVYGDQQYTGTVKVIGVRADKALRYPVEIYFKNDTEKPLKVGMFGAAHFSFDQPKEARVIPRQAIVGSLQSPSVYVIQDSTATLRKITVGTVLSDQVELIEGPETGEQVVVSGQINLEDGTKVTILQQQQNGSQQAVSSRQ